MGDCKEIKSGMTWEDLSEIRASIRQNKQIDNEKIIFLVDLVGHLWNDIQSEKSRVEETKEEISKLKLEIIKLKKEYSELEDQADRWRDESGN